MRGGDRRAVPYVPTNEVAFVPFETVVALRTSNYEWDVWHSDEATLVTSSRHGYVWTPEDGMCIGTTAEVEIYGDFEPENFVRIKLKAPRNKRKKAVLQGLGSVAVSQHVSDEGWTVFTFPVAHVEISRHGPTRLLNVSGPELIQGDSLIADPRIHFIHEWIPEMHQQT